MDETGHSGDTGAADGGAGADSRDRNRSNGWATPDSPWSNAGSALESEDDVPAWRRPTSSEARPFPENPERPFGSVPVPVQQSPVQPASGPPVPAPAPPGFVDAKTSGEIPASGDPIGESPRWEGRSRYADLLAPLAPEIPEPPRARSPEPGLSTGGFPGGPINRPAPLRGFDVATPNSAPPYPYEGDLDDLPPPPPPAPPTRATTAVPLVRPAAPGGRRPDWIATELGQEQARHALNQGTPLQGSPTIGRSGVGTSGIAGPTAGNASIGNPAAGGSGVGHPAAGSASVSGAGIGSPAVGSAGVGHSGVGNSGVGNSGVGGVGAGHPASGSAGVGGLGSPAAPVHGSPVPAPRPRTATQADKPVADEAKQARPSYDPSSFPRRLGYEPTPAAEPSGYTPPPAYSGFGGRGADPVRSGDPGDPRAVDPGGQGTRVLLPQRVPAQPDVPRVPEPPLVEPTAETPALARIATHLRRGDVLPAQERQEGFDVQAILAAVREVAGVRDASLRTTPAGAHSLRLDLAEGADPAEVSRRVARLLQDRMGLDAAMKGEAPSAPAPAPVRPVSPAHSLAQPRPISPDRPVSPAHPPDTARPPAAVHPFAPARPVSPAHSLAPPRPTSSPDLSSSPDPSSSPRPSSSPDSSSSPRRSSSPDPVAERARPVGESARPVAEPARSRAEPARPVGDPGRPAADRGRPLAEPVRPAGPAARAVAEPSREMVSRELPRAAAPVSAPPTRPEPTREESPAHHQRVEDAVPVETAVVPTGVEAQPRPLYPSHDSGPRIVIENVQVNTFGTDATVEVRLGVGGRSAAGEASGPAVDGYLLRLCAMATAGAVDQLLSTSDQPEGPVRCFVEHAAAVPFGSSQVAIAVLLLSCGGWVEQLAGSAVVTGDDRLAMVRATLAAVNRRLEALLSG